MPFFSGRLFKLKVQFQGEKNQNKISCPDSFEAHLPENSWMPRRAHGQGDLFPFPFSQNPLYSCQRIRKEARLASIWDSPQAAFYSTWQFCIPLTSSYQLHFFSQIYILKVMQYRILKPKIIQGQLSPLQISHFVSLLVLVVVCKVLNV